MSIKDENIIIFDGACGTSIHAANLDDAVWDAHDGCNEYLNLSAPEVIIDIHRDFLAAGAMVLETNTFGASGIVLAEYGLETQVEAINHRAVEHARQAIGNQPGRYVAGSIGPTTKLPSLGHITVDELADAMNVQIRALLTAGVDLLIVETCQDLLQVKTVLVCCFDQMEKAQRNVPVMLSVTIERQGTMLVGSDIESVVATVEPYPIFSLGLNCATGPEDMKSHIHYLNHNWTGRISCIPNQGLPEVVDGQTAYPMTPDDFAKAMKQFIVEDRVTIVGGCCGTTPGHIRALVRELEGI
ncbi:MAG: homocysteine S-methyltransferase family protein [Phycisphaerae bacterium]|nr:homocysteine S-methyltransferase family protein [Phycisphaerae bacterium]